MLPDEKFVFCDGGSIALRKEPLYLNLVLAVIRGSVIRGLRLVSTKKFKCLGSGRVAVGVSGLNFELIIDTRP